MNFKINYNECPAILNNFLNYLLSIKNYSIHTIKNYYLTLISFFKFIKEYMDIKINIKDFNIFILANVKESDIIAYLVHLNYNKDNTGQTRSGKLSHIRNFYKWLFSNYTPFNEKENPAKYITNIKHVMRLPKYLNLEEVKKMQNVFTAKNTKYPIRNNTIIKLFLNTGLRLSEMSNLNISDINFTNNTIRIVGKGNKEIVIYLNKNIKNQLLLYIKIRNRNQKITYLKDPLFISYQNKRLGIDGIEDICKKAFELAGLGSKNYSTHTLRHTSATFLYKSSKDINLVKEFLGHHSIKSTEIYTHVMNDKIKEAVNNNPLNNYILEKVA